MEMLKAMNPAKAAGLAAAKAQAEAMAEAMAEVAAGRSPRGFGWRMLPHFKVANGRRFQLHATRGWKCVGRVS